MANSARGFAAMDDKKQREIASMGGRASHGSSARNNSASKSSMAMPRSSAKAKSTRSR